MRPYLFCLVILFGLSAHNAFAMHDDYIIEVNAHRNEAIRPMLSVETGEGGYELTPFYKPVVYNEAYQKASLPPLRRMTLQAIVEYLRF